MTEEHLHKIIEDLGYMRGKIESIDEKVSLQNGNVAKMQTKLAKYDILLGKLGVGFSALVIVMSIIITVLTEAIKKMLHL